MGERRRAVTTTMTMNHPILTFSLVAIGDALAFAGYVLWVVSRIHFGPPPADRGASERPGREARALGSNVDRTRVP